MFKKLIVPLLFMFAVVIGYSGITYADDGWQDRKTFGQMYGAVTGNYSDIRPDLLKVPVPVAPYWAMRLSTIPDAEYVVYEPKEHLLTAKPVNEGKISTCDTLLDLPFEVAWQGSIQI